MSSNLACPVYYWLLANSKSFYCCLGTAKEVVAKRQHGTIHLSEKSVYAWGRMRSSFKALAWRLGFTFPAPLPDLSQVTRSLSARTTVLLSLIRVLRIITVNIMRHSDISKWGPHKYLWQMDWNATKVSTLLNTVLWTWPLEDICSKKKKSCAAEAVLTLNQFPRYQDWKCMEGVLGPRQSLQIACPLISINLWPSPL